MTKPVFNISASAINAETSASALLLMEVNESSFSYVIVDESQKLMEAAYFVLTHMEGRNLADAISEIIDAQENLQHDFKQSAVVYNFSETTLVPGSLYNHDANRDLMDLLFGNLKKGLVLSEKVDNAEMHTLYRIPAAVHSLLQQKFSAGKYWHMYTLWLAAIEKSSLQEGENVHFVFAADKVLTAAFRDRRLLLIQSFAYTTPEDVVYHLLHCFDQLGFSQDDCLLRISGYIDEDSALFNEIKKYFLRLEFDKVEEVRVVENVEATEQIEQAPIAPPAAIEEEPGFDERPEYPVHYFSYLQKLALCV